MSKRDALKKLMAQNNTAAKPIDERETPVDDIPVVKETEPAVENVQINSTKKDETELSDTAEVLTDNSVQDNSVNNDKAEPDVIIIQESPAKETGSDNIPSKSVPKEKSTSNKTNSKKQANAKRTLGEEINITSASTISWTCKIETETYLNFQLLVAAQGTNKLELINRIIENEIAYEADHPEFPEREFVLNNLKNKSIAQGDDYIAATFNITKENNLFLKKASQKCGMKMYVFLTYLINEYSDGLL